MRIALALLLLPMFPGAILAGDDDLLLVSKHSGKCVQVEGGGNANGAKISQGPCLTEAKITQWTCVDQSNVKWKERPAEAGYVYLENMETGKCMQVEGASFDSGTTISQWDCVDQNNVKWRIVPAALAKRVRDSDAIVGLWTHRDVGPIKIDRRDAGNYVITSASRRSPINNVGDTLDEVAYFGTNMQWDYVGRHMWGGSKTANQYWGQQDALVIRLDGPDEMFLVFLDSKYTGGWKFRRTRE